MNLTISTVTYRVGESKLPHFRHTLMLGMLQGEMPFAGASTRTPFRVFHIDTFLSGSSKNHHGFIVITRMRSQNSDPEHGADAEKAHQRHAREEEEVIALLVTTYDLTPCTSES